VAGGVLSAPQLAEEQARHALTILERRGDYLDELGNVQLVLGRALLQQERNVEAMQAFAAAEWTFERLGYGRTWRPRGRRRATPTGVSGTSPRPPTSTGGSPRRSRTSTSSNSKRG
jgi:hypothetical protein